MDQLWQSLSDSLVNYGGQVAVALLVLLAGWIFAGWLGSVTRRALARAQVDETLTKFLGKLARWVVLTLVILACLSVFGVETTSFAAVIGSAGIAVGLAFQGTLSNFAAGVMLLMFRPFSVGDVITVAGQTGKVNAIELFSTTLDTFDNRRFIVPNGQIFGSTIENITHHAQRRADVAVGVSYAADIDRTREVLTQAAGAVPGALADPEPAIVLLDLGDSAVNWSVRVWAKSDDFGAVKQAATRAVKVALDEAGIEIPFPQMDVHLTKAE
jgi:small conductance mechanosensitive channel